MNTGSQPHAVPEDGTPSTAAKPAMLCIMACRFCADPEFQRWAQVSDEKAARAHIVSICHCASRKDLDTHTYFANRFLRHIRGPFLAWKEAQ